MSTRRVFTVLLALILTSAACSFSGETTLVPTLASVATTLPASPTAFPAPAQTMVSIPALSALPPTLTSGAPGLTLDQLKNAKYHGIAYNKDFQLSDGKYEPTTDVTSPDYYFAALGDKVAFGDLNGDGVPDAAVTIVENGGGSGAFVSVVAMLNQGGQPVYTGALLLDDRPMLNNIAIQDGKIVVDAVIHGTNDPMCCPGFVVTETYGLTKSGLALLRFDSKTPSGVERTIRIDSPTPATQVGGAVEVKGRVSIAPFENTLNYKLYDPAGNVLAQGPVMVQSPDVGQPGTFDASIPLSAVSPGLDFRLEIADLSAANGYIQAMDSVELLKQ